MTGRKTERRYWDSSLFLKILNAEKPHDEICLRILQDAREGRTRIVVSALTLVEVIRRKGTPVPIPKEEARKVLDFFENDYIELHSLDRVIAEHARELCWEHPVKPLDACHLAIAIQTRCDFLETTDEGLLKRNGTIRDAALVIRKPARMA